MQKILQLAKELCRRKRREDESSELKRFEVYPGRRHVDCRSSFRTEPKIKFYIGTQGDSVENSKANVAKFEEAIQAYVD